MSEYILTVRLYQGSYLHHYKGKVPMPSMCLLDQERHTNRKCWSHEIGLPIWALVRRCEHVDDERNSVAMQSRVRLPPRNRMKVIESTA
eukprot:5439703-Amphidinium_carterae.2